MANHQVAVVSPDYCVPYPVDFTVVRRVFGMGDSDIVDANGNLIFRVKGSFSFHTSRVIIDAFGRPILTLRQKILTTHRRWKAFRGESTDDKDLIFSSKISSLFQFTTKLHVFLANNTSNEKICDYTVKGSWGGKSSEISIGDSSTLIAQMQKKFKLIGNDKFMVTVKPNTDCAFIVALIVIFDEISRSKRANNHHHPNV